MPSQSKAQQRFMGMVHATQKGDMENPSPEVEKAADGMTAKDSKEFASTKHAGLPDKKEDYAIRLKEHIRKLVKEMNTTGSVEGYDTPYAFSKSVFKIFYNHYTKLLIETKAKVFSVDPTFDSNGTLGKSPFLPMNIITVLKFFLAFLLLGRDFKKRMSEYHFYKI